MFHCYMYSPGGTTTRPSISSLTHTPLLHAAQYLLWLVCSNAKGTYKAGLAMHLGTSCILLALATLYLACLTAGQEPAETTFITAKCVS